MAFILGPSFLPNWSKYSRRVRGIHFFPSSLLVGVLGYAWLCFNKVWRGFARVCTPPTTVPLHTPAPCTWPCSNSYCLYKYLTYSSFIYGVLFMCLSIHGFSLCVCTEALGYPGPLLETIQILGSILWNLGHHSDKTWILETGTGLCPSLVWVLSFCPRVVRGSHSSAQPKFKKIYLWSTSFTK